jgi:hypothetical protein
VFERILKRFREQVRQCAYVMSIHAEEEMDEDGLTILDIESCVLTGRIIERQRDLRTRESKYVVRGFAIDGSAIGVVAKLSPTGRLAILTTYRE